MKSRILIDSNILVYSLSDSGIKTELARNFIIKHQSDLVVTPQNIVETLKVITHPKAKQRYSIALAVEAIKAVVANLEKIYLLPGSDDLICEYAVKYGVLGLRIFDLQLVIAMLQNDIDIIATNNEKDFRKYPIKILNPFV